MQCDSCGQNSDWIGGESECKHVAAGVGTGALLQCIVCGTTQHER